MASAVYILDLKGKILISRDYRGDTPNFIIQEKFVKRVIAVQESDNEEKDIRPVFEDGGFNFVFIQHKNLYLVAVARYNANVAMILSYLHKLVEVFQYYFKELEEDSIKDNFVVVYELLDEMMDFGFPQTTEPKILQEFIKMESHKLNIDTKALVSAVNGLNLAGLQGVLAQNLALLSNQFIQIVNMTNTTEDDKNADKVQLPRAVTQAVSWRPEGIVHKKNECFLDVVESVNISVSSTGQTLRSEILGALKMKVFLSGMPELKLGLNDKVLFENLGRSVAKGRAVDLEDVKFHQCVRLNRFETDRTISFIPPDGEFDLMNYRLNTKVKPLIWVECVTELHSKSRIEFYVKAKAQFKKKSTANNVEIYIPVPKDADTPSFRASMGTAEYVPDQNCIVWCIKQFQGAREFAMRAQVGLPSLTSEDVSQSYGELKKRPIQVKFDIPYFTVSGLQVRYLKVMEKSGYQALPWVRYLTKSGDYVIKQV